MKQSINVTYPKQLAFSLKMQDTEFVNEMKILALIKLYELGKISSGVAAKVLNISRIDFIELLQKYHVSMFSFNSDNDIKSDMKNA